MTKPDPELMRRLGADLWKLLESCKQNSFSKDALALLRERDPDFPKKNLNGTQFADYFYEVAMRFRAKMTIVVQASCTNSERFRSVTTSGVAPVKMSTRLRVHVKVTHPVFLYVVWIDSQGNAIPIFPWSFGDWTVPVEQRMTQAIDIPAPKSDFAIDTPAGAETCVAMGCIFRPNLDQLRQLSSSLSGVYAPRQIEKLPAVKSFRLDEYPVGEDRVQVLPREEDPEPLEVRHRELSERLRASGFDHAVGISVKNLGDAPETPSPMRRT